MIIAVGANHSGYQVRTTVIDLLKRLGHEVVDMGVWTSRPVDYPEIAVKVAEKVSCREVDRGILIGGTGLGMCIVANKIVGVRAVPCHDDMTAEYSRRHNDANVLCLSASLLGTHLITRIVEIWIKAPFEGGRHCLRVDKIAKLERTGGAVA